MATHVDGERKASVERLFEVLEAYGADPARWPEAERDGLLRLVASGDAAVETALKAARELDSVLAAASVPALDVGASRERFLAGMGEKIGEVAPPVAFGRHRSGRWRAGAIRRLPWPAFGALAASLAAGLYVGAGGLARDFIPPLLADEVSEEELWSPMIFGDDLGLVEDNQ